jgi:hypothetical protein
MVDERVDEFGHVPSRELSGESYDRNYPSEIEGEASLTLIYDSDVDDVGPAEEEQFEKAVQVLEESGRAEVGGIHHFEEAIDGNYVVAQVYTENEDDLRDFVGKKGQDTELAVADDIKFDIGLYKGLQRHMDETENAFGRTDPLEAISSLSSSE